MSQQHGPSELLATQQPLFSADVRAANRSWWDEQSAIYQKERGPILGDVEFVWGPEGLREADVRLLGDVRNARVLELGCGAAACARWLVGQGAAVTALDLSGGMLAEAQEAARRTAIDVPLIQADALYLPFGDGAFNIVCTSFGVVPFITDTGLLIREVFRVVRPGGRWVFSTYHPMRWIFNDVPDETGLIAVHSYFDRRPYVERDEQGRLTYLEQHRTIGDHIRDLVAAGFVVRDVVEPEWPADYEHTWDQWTPLRGRIFPGTAIFVAERPA